MRMLIVISFMPQQVIHIIVDIITKNKKYKTIAIGKEGKHDNPKHNHQHNGADHQRVSR